MAVRGGSHALPSGTVCFLFTDVEASTELLKTLGDAGFAQLLERMHSLLRSVVQANGGVVVNTEGDGSFSALGSSAGGLQAAVVAQRMLREADWAPTGFRVRMGLHTGTDITPRAGDYVALAVHQAARVCAAANGGQVLVTDKVVADAVDAVAVTDLGLFSVRDFDGPVRLYEVRDVSLPTCAPRVPPAFDSRVPSYRHGLVGREAEIADVIDYLERGSFVSLVGPAGVGKTRLAVAVLSHLSLRLAAGPWFVDLTEAREPRAVGEVIAAAIGCPPDTEIGVHLDRLLDDRRGVMVLDHCEHLIDAAGSVAQMLMDWCPTLQVIATTTAPLGTPAEVICPVEPLAVPAHAEAAEVLDSSSGRLFVERAGLVGGGLELTSQARQIREVCTAVGGMPLAIEAVAALSGRYELTSVVERIGDGSVPAVVDAVLESLQPADLRALCALALAESPIANRLATATVSAVGVSSDDVAALLARLVSSSLVRLDPDGRHSLLQTVRARILTRISNEDRRAVLRALLSECAAILDASSGPLSRFEPVVSTATTLLHESLLPGLARQRLAVQLSPWWIGRLGAARARELLLEVLALDPDGAGAAAIHLAVADTYAPGTETVDTERHVHRAAALLGEHDTVDPGLIERLQQSMARARRDQAT